MTCTEMAFFPANFMLSTPHEDDHQPPTSLAPILHPCTTQDFHGSFSLSHSAVCFCLCGDDLGTEYMVLCVGIAGVASFLGKRSMSFSGLHDVCEENNGGEDDLSDEEGSQAGGEKKRRLNMEQVKTLEKNFELGNKLEPERKMHLARALGLQPRQIAIWFQNRRARWKTKQLEKDYEVLKRQFDALKAEKDSLQSQNHKLHSELMALKNREPIESINLNVKETEGSSSNRSENSSEIKLDISRTPAIDSPPLPGHPILTSRSLFPSSFRPSTGVAQLFQNSPRPDQNVKEESFCNMFCGIDDQTGFWPWLEQQHFN
ncbi:hypothetical protein RJ639_044904 [Escallonia herrerae]|uniref:Homeobox-leucine zipper protein n=1 Tax=Escallonia herrerae TaxID=1293975 RepID=A0AA89B1E2_9ASTE|nr:hypothetical protein RJ639_044904 [Escallonia herrerae]